MLWEAEVGMFQDLPKSIVSALTKLAYDSGVEVDYEIQSRYHEWQHQEREKLRGKVIHVPQFMLGTEISPMEQLRRDIAPTGLKTFCDLFKVPRMTIRRYETGETRSMPVSLAAALSEIEYPHTRALTERQNEWLRSQ